MKNFLLKKSSIILVFFFISITLFSQSYSCVRQKITLSDSNIKNSLIFFKGKKAIDSLPIISVMNYLSYSFNNELCYIIEGTPNLAGGVLYEINRFQFVKDKIKKMQSSFVFLTKKQMVSGFYLINLNGAVYLKKKTYASDDTVNLEVAVRADSNLSDLANVLKEKLIEL